MLPQETFLVVNGTNLKQSWQNLTEQAEDNPSSEAIIEQISTQVRKADLAGSRRQIFWRGWMASLRSLPYQLLKGSGECRIWAGSFDPNQRSGCQRCTFCSELSTVAETAAGGILPQRIELATETIGDRELTTWQAEQAKVATLGYASDDYMFWTTGDLAKQFIPPPTGTYRRAVSLRFAPPLCPPITRVIFT
jgi:hypothetical protein